MKRKIVYAALSLLIAVGMWLYVITVVNPESDQTFYNIPVVLENEEVLTERGLMITSSQVPTVTLRLLGNRTDLINLDSSNITIVADLSRIYSAGEQKLSYTITYPGNVASNAIEIINQSPTQISLTISERKTKEVPVRVSFTGTLAEQHIAFKESATLDYETITVTGPASVVESIEYARIEVDLEGQTDTISESYTYTLCDADSNEVTSEWLTTNVSEVRYTLKIQQWKEIELTLDVVDGGGLTVDDCEITIEPSTIQIAGTDQLLSNLDSLQLGQLKLGELTEDYTGTYTIELPEGITNLSEVTTATVTVTLPALAVREFTVTDIQAINVPEGMEVEIISQEKVVQLRGPRLQIYAMTAEDITILVDMTEAEIGSASYEATVQIADAYAQDVGLIGSCEVNVRVTQQTEEAA